MTGEGVVAHMHGLVWLDWHHWHVHRVSICVYCVVCPIEMLNVIGVGVFVTIGSSSGRHTLTPCYAR